MIKKAIHIILLSLVALPTSALALITTASFFGKFALWTELLSHFVFFPIVSWIVKILVGDLNCSPWSYYFQKLLDETDLSDSELGFGPQPTWSPGGKLVPLLPIDHFLVSKDFVVADHCIERFAGADHRPVFVDLWLKPKSNDNQAMPGGVR